MVIIADRRVVVRDDGTGRSSKEPRPFSAFADADAIILLGNPGSGKSTLFEACGGSDTKPVRVFLLAPHTPVGAALFLDGLDEYRKATGTASAIDDLSKALVALGKPKFRLSCRSADWFGELDQSIVRAASPTGRVVVLDLLPLDDAEVRAIVGCRLDQPDELIDDARAFGITDLLANPQTLDLMIRAWRSGHRPRTKFDAYHHGIDNLLLETNKAHQARGSAASTPSIPELRRAAGAASSALLLSHATALSRVDVSPGEQDLIPLSVVPFEHAAVVEHVLGRRVFSSLVSDRFQPVHRTIAEFLAAEDLSRRVRNGLPISRVLALMCGPDGAPVSALRGLFAWLMCHLGADAERHVGRDPYAVATYADGAHLPPAAQSAVWTSLASADDPWFFANENERGTFHGLANKTTKSVIRGILSDRDTSTHLTVACLEAVAACSDDLDLHAEITAHAFADDDNTWLRTAALRALLRQGSDTTAASLEQQLAARTADTSAASLRIALLREIPRPADCAARVISILQQYKNSRGAGRVVGTLYPLREMITPEDRDALLDASASLLPEHGSSSVDLEHLFKDVLIDRLSDTAAPIDPARLLSWLARIKSHQSNGDVDAALGIRLRHEPPLFDGLFDAAVRKAAPTTAPDIIRALRIELGRWVPDRVWPCPPHAYLLDRASGEANAALAAGYFMESIHCIPSVGFTSADADAAMALLDARPDIAAAACGWDRYALDDYQIAERTRVISVREETERNRATNVAELAPNLAAISAGTHIRALTWAVQHFGRKDGNNTAPFNARLVKRTDETTARAIIDGMANFITTANLPSVDDMHRCGRENSFSSHVILLMISAWMRLRDNQPIPAHAEAAVIAGAIVNTEIFVRVPDANAVFADWFAGRLTNPQSPARAMLADAWRDSVDRGETSLPRFYDLAKREDCTGVLSDMAPAVFGASRPPTADVALAVIRHLLAHDREALLRLAPKPTNPPANDGLAGIWLAATFAADPAATGLRERFAILSATDAWSAIDVWRGDDLLFGPMSPLTADKTAEMIVAVGARFHNAGQPLGSSCGRHNDHDAASFVSGHIKALAAHDAPEAGQRLALLAQDQALSSYRDLVRHYMAQRQRHRREAAFEAPDRDRIAATLTNAAPSNTADLWAFVADHLNAVSAEIRGTSYARLDAYWSGKSREYEQPKDEPVCSRLLAADLQARLAAANLIVTVEHFMVAEKRCDIVVLQATTRLLPIEVKHHYHPELWTAWRAQLDAMYASDVRAGGYGIYCVLWSGVAGKRRTPSHPDGQTKPASALELQVALTSLIPKADRERLCVVVVDISPVAR